MFYSERELLGAIVVDSEGYVAGIVERLTPQEEGLQIVVRRKRGGKATFSWDDVRSAYISELGKCIILNNPAEAVRRGIKLDRRPLYYGTDYVQNMLVIDLRAKILGVAVDVTFHLAKPPTLRVVKAKKVTYKEVDDIDGLINSLVPSRYPTVLELLKRVLLDLKKRGKYRAEDVKRKYLIPWARSKGIRIPKKRVLQAGRGDLYTISWSDIGKVGDVILLNKVI